MSGSDDDQLSASADAARRAFGDEQARDVFGATAVRATTAATRRPVAGGPRGPRDERWVPLAVVVLSLLATGLLLWRAERAALEDPVKQGARGEVVGAEGHSLLRAANLRPALAAVARRLDRDEVVTDLQLTPVQLRLSVRDGEAHQRQVSVDLAGEVRTGDGGTNTSDGPAITRIDGGAPERLVAAALRSRSYAPRTVTSVAWRFDGAQERQQWTLTLKDVPIADQSWIADATAAHVRRSGDPEPPAPDPAQELPATTATTPPAVPATPAPRPRPRPGTPPRSGAVVVQVGGTTIVTDPAAGRRLQRCLARARGRTPAVRRCVEGLR